jgi:hypothetical protein
MSEEPKQIPIKWYFPEHVETKYATNLIIQHTEEEFIISFFEIFRPPILGDDTERKKAIEQIKFAEAKCVSRVAITPDKVPNIIKALQENLKRYNKRQEEISKEKIKEKEK